MKTVLVTGAHGLLGQYITRFLLQETHARILATAREPQSIIKEEIEDLHYETLDTFDRDHLKALVTKYFPDVIINCVGMIDIERCETERELAWRSNVKSVEHLVEACRKVDAHIIHLSSDFIFDGTNGPYSETSVPNPINYYGKTKLAAENILRTSGIPHSIVRTQSVFGFAEDPHERHTWRPNFLPWVVEQSERGVPFSVPNNQYAMQTFVLDVAVAIGKIIERERTGIYHICGSELLSRYEFAQLIAKTFGFETSLVKGVTLKELGRVARPLRSEFITLKAETDLGFRATKVTDAVALARRQFETTAL